MYYPMTLTQVVNLAKEHGKPLCCIARFNQTGEAPHVFYRVVVYSDKVTQSGKFIRFEGLGCEVQGFKPMDSMEVHEILGTVEDEIVTPLPIEPVRAIA